MGFKKIFMGVKFVDHRPMFKLLPRFVIGQCSMISYSTLLICFVKIFSQVSKNVGFINVGQIFEYAIKITR